MTPLPNDLDHLLFTCEVTSLLLVISLIEVMSFGEAIPLLMIDHLLVNCQVISLSLEVAITSSSDNQMVEAHVLIEKRLFEMNAVFSVMKNRIKVYEN